MTRQASFQIATISGVTPDIVTSGNNNRVMIHIQNKSGGTVYVRFGSLMTQDNGIWIAIEIPPNGDYICDQNCPHDPIYMVGDDVLDGNTVVIMEVNEI